MASIPCKIHWIRLISLYWSNHYTGIQNTTQIGFSLLFKPHLFLCTSQYYNTNESPSTLHNSSVSIHLSAFAHDFPWLDYLFHRTKNSVKGLNISLKFSTHSTVLNCKFSINVGQVFLDSNFHSLIEFSITVLNTFISCALSLVLKEYTVLLFC